MLLIHLGIHQILAHITRICQYLTSKLYGHTVGLLVFGYFTHILCWSVTASILLLERPHLTQVQPGVSFISLEEHTTKLVPGSFHPHPILGYIAVVGGAQYDCRPPRIQPHLGPDHCTQARQLLGLHLLR